MRLVTVKTLQQKSPVDKCEGSWLVSSQETSREFSAVSFQYGQLLQKYLGVPVGIIIASVGGSPIRAWASEKVIDQFHRNHLIRKKYNALLVK